MNIFMLRCLKDLLNVCQNQLVHTPLSITEKDLPAA